MITVLAADWPSITFWYSFRAPYSQLAIDRVFTIRCVAKAWGVSVQCKPVLPMVMRGLTVGSMKGGYIDIQPDAAHEAAACGFKWELFRDPVDDATRRAFSLWPLVQAEGKEESFLRAFSVSVYTEGIEAAGDRGMKIIAERAGLEWSDCAPILAANGGVGDTAWEVMVEENLKEMLTTKALWGVPTCSFAFGKWSAWGQDRLRALENAVVGELTKTNSAL